MSDEQREALEAAVESIEDADPDSITLYDDGTGHFLIKSDADEQDVDAIDEALEDAGFERDGHIPVPDLTQQNVRPLDENQREGSA
jgi:sugar phosphate isomerase/epimerase